MKKVSIRSIVVVLLVIGVFVLAVIDEGFRPAFADIAKFGIGGYLGQLVPRQKLTS